MMVYCVDPIDQWSGWHCLDTMVDDPDIANEAYPESITKAEVEAYLSAAQAIAKEHLGWEGDVIQGPFWTAIPNEQGSYWSVFMVAWKQKNNGTTFVASPFPIFQYESSVEPSDKRWAIYTYEPVSVRRPPGE